MPLRLPTRPRVRSALRTFAVLALPGAGACTGAASRETDSATAAPAAAAAAPAPAPAPRDTAWRSLMDPALWRGYKAQALPAGWRVEQGELRRVAEAGDIITRDQYGDFELELEWKVGPKGNSGIFYRVTEQGDAAYTSGIEMQVLDDAGHADGRTLLTSAGALYGLYPAQKGVARPAGEWNRARVVSRGNHVEHWLNGVRVVTAEVWNDAWNARHKASKFTEWPEYARAARGHIGLQDHGDPVAFRNVRIRSLD